MSATIVQSIWVRTSGLLDAKDEFIRERANE